MENKFGHLFGGHGGGALHKIQTSSQWRQTYVQQGKTIEKFFIYGPKCDCFTFLAIWEALGAFNDQTGPILLSSYPLTMPMYMWNKYSENAKPSSVCIQMNLGVSKINIICLLLKNIVYSLSQQSTSWQVYYNIKKYIKRYVVRGTSKGTP